ncbi:NUDIX hydrolase [Chondrinema litorale]|uniref:NUDIX hydrolase n=1 Tax=Chondrinema litorale TaxID=2994555 RepID=UPI002543D2BD|nr:NUDIX hydrolase [Chondrinema litorale]UZR93839.1 NUDIX hydrolase [Chondrinema litorale]
MALNWIEVAKRIQAIAQNGLTFSEGMYDIDRYEELRDISVKIMAEISEEPVEKVKELFASATGYQTPKVDIRGVVFEGDKILMIKEIADNKWSLPGGWADVNYSPAEIVCKEVWEESGIEVKALRLLAVCDKHKHPHPHDPYHAYKMFFLCERTGGELKTGMETLDVSFFAEDDLPELSVDRVTESQINMLFDFKRNPEKETYFD